MAHIQHSGFSSPRINLSPFTKDFRGEEHYNESIDLFLGSCIIAGRHFLKETHENSAHVR